MANKQQPFVQLLCGKTGFLPDLKRGWGKINNGCTVFLDLKSDFVIRNIHHINLFGNILIGGARILGNALADKVFGVCR